jgi:predicted methyltransferase
MPLTARAHEIVRQHLKHGDIAVDATAGNGHDTLFLAECVGPWGTVYALDIQPESIQKLLKLLPQIHCIQADHAKIYSLLPAGAVGRVGAVMFNLGYLPGGDHAIITVPTSTVPALDGAWALLRPGGVLSVMAYTGHTGGPEERDEVQTWFHRVCLAGYQHHLSGQTLRPGPELFVAVKPA